MACRLVARLRGVRRVATARVGVSGAAGVRHGVFTGAARRVARGDAPETFRLYRPDDVLAFSGVDAASPGFDAAVAAARAAASRRRCVSPAVAPPSSTPRRSPSRGRSPRPKRATASGALRRVADLIAAALRGIGVDARVGEVPGEYCPGEYSVNARGARKLMGVGQRVIRGAAHVGGVIVVQDAPACARCSNRSTPRWASRGILRRPEASRTKSAAVTIDDVRACDARGVARTLRGSRLGDALGGCGASRARRRCEARASQWASTTAADATANARPAREDRHRAGLAATPAPAPAAPSSA